MPIRPQSTTAASPMSRGTEMTMFAAFTPPAHQAVVRSGRLAADAGRRVLSTDFLLLGLTEVHDLDPPLERLGITAAAVRAQIDQQHGAPRRVTASCWPAWASTWTRSDAVPAWPPRPAPTTRTCGSFAAPACIRSASS